MSNLLLLLFYPLCSFRLYRSLFKKDTEIEEKVQEVDSPRHKKKISKYLRNHHNPPTIVFDIFDENISPIKRERPGKNTEIDEDMKIDEFADIYKSILDTASIINPKPKNSSEKVR